MNVMEAISKTKTSLISLTNKKFNGVVGIEEEESGWKITVELVERESIPDSSDVLGIYEIKLNPLGDVVSFSRVGLRRRGDAERPDLGV